MQRFTLPLLAAKQMARAITPHIARDFVTPVLTGAVVGGERFGQHAYATDRYTMGRYDLTNLFVEEPTGEVWVPKAALTILNSIGKASLLYGNLLSSYNVTFETGNFEGRGWTTSVTVEYKSGDQPGEMHWFRAFPARGADGNFPPTERLFESFIPGEVMRVGIGYEQLVKFAPVERNGAPLRITMPKDTSTGRKMNPILVESGTRFKGLLAPNLLLEGGPGFGPDLAMENLAKAKESEANNAAAKVKPMPEDGGE